MTLNPHIQAKAQAELDLVIGSKRFPTLADRGSLPYVGYVVDECYRWGVPVPLSKLSIEQKSWSSYEQS